MSPLQPKYEFDHGEILMRLVVTRCRLCEKITDAKHADTINDLELISSFIREKRNLQQEVSILDYRQSDNMIRWCNCYESMAVIAQ